MMLLNNIWFLIKLIVLVGIGFIVITPLMILQIIWILITCGDLRNPKNDALKRLVNKIGHFFFAKYL